VLFRSASEESLLDRIAPFTAAMTLQDGKAVAYACAGNICSAPITDPEKLVAVLKGNTFGTEKIRE